MMAKAMLEPQQASADAKLQAMFHDGRQYELFQKCMARVRANEDPAQCEKFQRHMAEVKGKRTFLSEEMYAQLKALAPIVCVDVLVVLPGPHGEVAGVLVPRRAERDKAAEGMVWPIGGRTFYQEDLEDTVMYNVFNETGGLQVKMMGNGPIAVGRSEFDIVEKGRDTVNLTCLAVVSGGELKPSRYFNEYSFVDRDMFLNNPRTHYICSYTYELLRVSGVFADKPNPGIPFVRYNERTDEEALHEAERAIRFARRRD
jgi:hypothetical protein